MPVLRVYGQWVVVTVLLAVVLFASAGRVDLPMFWAYLVVHSGAQLAMALLVFQRNRDLLEERQNPGVGAKAWDRRLLRVYTLLTMTLFVAAGLDVGRLHWSDALPLWGQIVALAGFALSFAFSIWAMVVNDFYSRVVRIQGDRGQHGSPKAPTGSCGIRVTSVVSFPGSAQHWRLGRGLPWCPSLSSLRRLWCAPLWRIGRCTTS